MNLKNSHLILLIASTSLTFSAMAQTPVKVPEKNPVEGLPAAEKQPPAPGLGEAKPEEKKPELKKEEKLFITGRIQVRAMSGQQDTFWSTGTSDYNIVDFNFRRLRLGAVYQLDKHWGMVVDMRLENALNRSYVTTKTGNCGGTTCVTGVTLNDSRGLLQEANLSYQHEFLGLAVSLGLIRMPFNREYFTTSANLINIERAMATNSVHQWDNGLRIDLYPLRELLGPKYKYFLGIYGMVSTGHGGAGDAGYGRRYDTLQTQGGSSATVSPMFSGRVEYNVFGGLAKEGKEIAWREGDEIFQKELKISIGAGFLGTNETKAGERLSTEYTPRSTAISLTSASGAGACVALASGESCNLFAQTYDITATYAGFYGNVAYQHYGGRAGGNVTGYNVTLGYNMPVYGKAYLMPVVRYDFMKANTAAPNSSGLSSDPANQFHMVWVGINLFHSHHNLKLQLFYNIFANQYKGYDAAGNSLGGYSQNLLIFQAQVNFKTGVGI